MFSDSRCNIFTIGNIGKRELVGDHRWRNVILTFLTHKPNSNKPCADDGSQSTTGYRRPSHCHLGVLTHPQVVKHLADPAVFLWDVLREVLVEARFDGKASWERRPVVLLACSYRENRVIEKLPI